MFTNPYSRMELLRKLLNFGAPHNDLLTVYKTLIRSVLEQSSNVWHSGLTVEQQNDLERVQKVALKLILQENYQSYENALNMLDLDTLKDRREYLCLKFARKSLKNPKMKALFPPNIKEHTMETRDEEHFKVFFSNTNRYRDSPIIYMQTLLNNDVKRRKHENNLWNI